MYVPLRCDTARRIVKLRDKLMAMRSKQGKEQQILFSDVVEALLDGVSVQTLNAIMRPVRRSGR